MRCRLDRMDDRRDGSAVQVGIAKNKELFFSVEATHRC
jgi:hypothetical protein